MNPEQFTQLLSLLEKLASRQFTIASAADWPILATVGGALVAVIAFMWMELRSVIKDHRGEWRDELEKHREENEKDIKIIWDAYRDCQHECCPRRSKE